MADVRCPMCGRPNSDELEECQYCGARLKPLTTSTPADDQTLKPGDEPIRRGTSEFEKAGPSADGPIHPGEAPTIKNTGELEHALPSWLRSLREEKRPAAGESLAEPSPDEGLPAASKAMPGSDSSSTMPDWLAGLGNAASEEEEVPDWLAGLRGGETSESEPAPAEEEEPSLGLGNEDWMKRLGSEPPEVTPEPTDATKFPKTEITAAESSPEPTSEDRLPDWLQNMRSPGPDAQEPPAASSGREKFPDWLSGLPDLTAESTLDGLDQPKQESISTEAGTPAEGGESVPDWLSGFRSVQVAPDSPPAENVPEWLSNRGGISGPESGTPEAFFDSAQSSEGNPPASSPDWLSRLQPGADAPGQDGKPKEDFEPVPEAPASTGSTEPLPDWLVGIVETPLPSNGAPALFGDNKDTYSGEQGETAFSMETPDWLSKLNPDMGGEKAAEGKDGQVDSGNIETAELPSWVQAMRPVEAVVESKTTPLNENQVTELSGPLAGLRGVLPAEPGLGLLRKPPLYSSKLQISDGQSRYAKSLEQLVAGETHPRPVETTRLPSNRSWRWWITLLLFLAVGLPFVSGLHVAPATLLLSSDKGASSRIIEGLPENVPVLVAFDFDPALFGELEAVAAPIMDQLLSKGTPLALISTTPTGPALAENFLKSTTLVNVHQYQSGKQYVNLGFLAGGPAGMLYLADSLTDAMPVSVDGKSAWKAGPLRGVQSLSTFAAVIILTDNADTGRNWIEQAGPRLGNTPMLMIISTQAEPMIRPYFDSGQLKGLVSGLSDAKIYEQTYNRPGLAYHYWNSFSIGMLVAELLIAVGAIMGLMVNRRVIRKNSRGEA
jgi:hypothetical protein